MNPVIAKFGPPTLVFGIALYLGWPPAEPMDLGEQTVRAKSVRWKASDLEVSENPPVLSSDPFKPVLVAQDVKVEQRDAQSAPVNSQQFASESMIRAELMLAGIATMGGKQWAVINGKTRVAGDELIVDGQSVMVQAIRPDHVVLQSGPREIVLRAHRQPRSKRAMESFARSAKSSHTSASAPGADQTWQAGGDPKDSSTQNSAASPVGQNNQESPGEKNAPALPIKLPFNLPL